MSFTKYAVTCWYKNGKSNVYYIDISLVDFELQFLTCSLEWVLVKLMYHGGPHGSCLFTSCSTSLWRSHWKSTSAVHTRKTKVPLLCLLANYVNNKNLFGYIWGLSLILHVATDFSFFTSQRDGKSMNFKNVKIQRPIFQSLNQPWVPSSEHNTVHSSKDVYIVCL